MSEWYHYAYMPALFGLFLLSVCLYVCVCLCVVFLCFYGLMRHDSVHSDFGAL